MTDGLPSRHPFVLIIALLAMSGVAVAARGQEPVAGATDQEPQKVVVPVEDATATSERVEHKRVAVPSLGQKEDHPFTIEIPVNWGVRRDLAAVGVFLGPATGDPNTHPEMLLVHRSDVSLSDPETVLANLRANARAADWSLREAEVRDFGGVEGLWIVREMPPAGLHGQRVSFATKLPLGNRSLDVIATVPVEQHEALEPAIRHMLQSILPAEAAASEPEE